MIMNRDQRLLRKLVKKINALAPELETISDEKLKHKTVEFKERIQNGESLDSLLVEAFAVCREASRRVLGLFPYDVQVMGGIVIHQGRIAEMATGEGKTLTATMPLYLNALSGQSAILVTVNGYLAKRDAEEMGPIYEFLGLSVAFVGGEEDKEDEMSSDNKDSKQDLYQSDIVYTTNATLAFDYLIENLSSSLSDRVLPEFNFVVIDEIDSVLLDTAQMPLIISGAPRVHSNFYQVVNTLVTTLDKDNDYKVDKEKAQVWLTRKGIIAAEQYFGVENLFEQSYEEIVRHIYLALKAHELYTRDKDYIVRNKKEVLLLDSATGRALEGTKLEGGMHQAIETKESVPLSPETRAMASITYQNFFNKFKKISGMTGTGWTVREEFMETYSLKVVQIPTNKPVIRRDLPDQLYATIPEKIVASLQMILDYHAKGNPILVFTGSVELSIIYSNLLLREGIAHNLLNANNAAREAQIIKEAGQFGAVTVATSMAGRGTDIKLSKEVRDLGGLVVVGVERMENQRVDLQIRGRSGRQGDPGISKFFISLEDDVIRKWGPSWVRKNYNNYSVKTQNLTPNELKKRKYRKIIKNAQKASEANGKAQRQSIVEYAQSMNIQREMMYARRNLMIEGQIDVANEIKNILHEHIETASKNQYETSMDLYRYILDNISYQACFEEVDVTNSQAVSELIHRIANDELKQKYSLLQTSDRIQEFHRLAILKAIDANWIEQVDYLQQLRSAMSGYYVSQKNPLVEYYQEAYEGFEDMKSSIKKQVVQNLLLSTLEVNDKGKIYMNFP